MGLEKINEMRKIRGISIDELCQKSGVPKGTLSKITSGITKNPSVETVKAIVHSMGFTLDDLDDDKKKEYNFFLLSNEKNIVQKYRTLDDHGKKMVDFTLNEEYSRIQAIEALTQLEENEEEEGDNTLEIDFSAFKASAGNGYMLFDDDTETKTVLYNDLTRKADICIGVSGDSMEPEYFDGDILMVRKQPSVDIGEIGIFIMDGNGYVKKQGEHCLVSLNKKYGDIYPAENNDIICYGKVLGKMEKEWIIKK